MFAVIYKFRLKEHQEEPYQLHWQKVARFFIEQKGAIGSCLHKGKDNLWIAYSRWPDKATRDASWPGENLPIQDLPAEIAHSVLFMQTIQKENKDLINSFEEFCMTVVNDQLVNPG